LWLHSLASSVVENHRTPTISALPNRGLAENKVVEFTVPLCRDGPAFLIQVKEMARRSDKTAKSQEDST
jgi:hypothetical protein